MSVLFDYLNDGGVAILIFAFASWTKYFLLSHELCFDLG